MAPNDQPPRLSPKDVNVLRQLADRDKYGLELVAESDGELRRNAVYVLLARMEEKGLIASREEPTPIGQMGPARRVYKLAGLGQRALYAHEAMLAHWAGRTA